MFDLLLKGGRVVDPAQNLDGPNDVAFAGGRIAAVDRDIPADKAREVVDVSGKLVVPGLIDLHTHVYWGGTSLGVDADAIARRSGTTTFVDAGSAGAGNFLGFRKHVIERSRVRIVAYLNISFAGIYGFAKNLMVGENTDIRMCDAREAVAVANEHRDLICGMKVRVGRIASGNNGAGPFNAALEAADRLQMPLMTHLDYPPPARHEVMPYLRPGDVITHCFKPFPSAPIDGKRDIRPDVIEARKRGVIFDIGHGMGSLGFETASTMLSEGFLPDVISSDVHTLCIDGPAYDLLHTMSKFLCLGMNVTDVIRTATVAPADAIGRSDLGNLKTGSLGDAAILSTEKGKFAFVDSLGEKMVGDERFVCGGIVTNGSWWPNDGTVAGDVVR